MLLSVSSQPPPTCPGHRWVSTVVGKHDYLNLTLYRGVDLWYGDFITPTITHILLCQKEDYKHKQAWPIQWVQREQLQPDNGSHGDGRPAVQKEEVQHWPLPLLLSEFSPGRNHCLLGSKGTWIAIEMIATNLNESVNVHTCIWVSTSLWLLPAPAYLDCIQTLAFQTCAQFLSPYLE